MLKKFHSKLNEYFGLKDGDRDLRKHRQFIFMLLILSIVSLFMTVVNYFTHWYALGLITLMFGIGSIINLILEIRLKDKMVGRVIFAIEFVAMFTAFLVIGEPEGFSVFWILLLPSCGFFLFGLRYGTIVNLAQLLIVLFYCYTDLGRSALHYQYTESFYERFPLVYVAFLFVGILLEFTINTSEDAIINTQKQFEYLHNHDALTGLFNRTGFNETMSKFLKNFKGQSFAFAILDLDHFKAVNDTYGHLAGDMVLKEEAKLMEKVFSDEGIVCRWGGEEFSILINDVTKAQALFEELLKLTKAEKIDCGEEKIIQQLTIGLVLVPENVEVDINKLIGYADANLYEGKQTGRGKIVTSEYK